MKKGLLMSLAALAVGAVVVSLGGGKKDKVKQNANYPFNQKA